MSTLTVETGGRSWTFEEPLVVTVGRDPASAVVLTGATASRRHAEIRSDGNGWVLVDIGSTSGTYLNGTRVSEVRLTGQTEVRFGAVDGEPMRLTVVGAVPPPPRPTSPAAGIPPNLEHTVVPGAGPAGFPQFGGGPGILVRLNGEGKRFAPGTIVRIGRDPANEIVIDDDPSVSRLHGTVEMRSDGWWYFDRSTAGTFDEEDRVTQRRLDEPTTLMLGHPTAGAEVELVPIVAAGQAQKKLAAKKRTKVLALTAGVVGALLLVGGGITAAAVLGDDDAGDTSAASAGQLTDEELDRAKAASVWIIAVDDSGQSLYTGSGSIISEDGLVLTNAHVGKPSAPGQEPPAEDPAGLLIALPRPDDLDGAVEVRYSAEPVVADGVLDLAVLRITGDAEGNEVPAEDLDLPDPLPIGDSDELRTGDDLVALGYPGLASITLSDMTHRGLSTSEGVVSTFNAEEGVGERAWIDSDVRIGSGNSGGPSINDEGELVAINSAVVTEATSQGAAGSFTGGSALLRPSNLAAEIIAIAEEGGDPSYVSPFLDSMPEPPDPDEMTGLSLESGGWSVDGTGGCATPSTPEDPQTLRGATIPGTVYAEYVVTGVPDGTPFEIQFWSLDGEQQLGSIDGTWDQGESETCAVIGVDIPEAIEGVNAVLVVGEAGVDNPVLFK